MEALEDQGEIHGELAKLDLTKESERGMEERQERIGLKGRALFCYRSKTV